MVWMYGDTGALANSYCGLTKSCTTLKPREAIVRWYLQGNHPSSVSYVVRNGFRPGTVRGRLLFDFLLAPF